MTDGEILYLALCAGAALAFVLALTYATTVASKGPGSDTDLPAE